MTGPNLRRPTDRVCERCGREETWDSTVSSWRIVADDEKRRVGNVYCIHEWNINGRFAPFED